MNRAPATWTGRKINLSCQKKKKLNFLTLWIITSHKMPNTVDNAFTADQMEGKIKKVHSSRSFFARKCHLCTKTRNRNGLQYGSQKPAKFMIEVARKTY